MLTTIMLASFLVDVALNNNKEFKALTKVMTKTLNRMINVHNSNGYIRMFNGKHFLASSMYIIHK